MAVVTWPCLSWRFPHWFSTWRSLRDHRYLDVFPTSSLHGGHYVTIAILTFSPLILNIAVITWPTVSWRLPHWLSTWWSLRDQQYLGVYPTIYLHRGHYVTIAILTFTPLVIYLAVITWPAVSWRLPHWLSTSWPLRDHRYLDVFPNGSHHGRGVRITGHYARKNSTGRILSFDFNYTMNAVHCLTSLFRFNDFFVCYRLRRWMIMFWWHPPTDPSLGVITCTCPIYISLQVNTMHFTTVCTESVCSRYGL